jgi:maltoporin
LFHVKNGFMGGYNKFSVQFGYGGSSDIESPLFYKAPTQPLQESMQLLVTESAQINLNEQVTAMGAALVRWRDNGDDTSDMWLSAGVRPIYHFTKYTALAAEAGVDFVRVTDAADETLSGTLFKLSVAPQIKAGQFFWARPVIRAYATAAMWTEEFQGAIGGLVHATDKFGMAFGVQAENWW